LHQARVAEARREQNEPQHENFDEGPRAATEPFDKLKKNVRFSLSYLFSAPVFAITRLLAHCVDPYLAPTAKLFYNMCVSRRAIFIFIFFIFALCCVCEEKLYCRIAHLEKRGGC
jgi:hypothetical protein